MNGAYIHPRNHPEVFSSLVGGCCQFHIVATGTGVDQLYSFQKGRELIQQGFDQGGLACSAIALQYKYLFGRISEKVGEFLQGILLIRSQGNRVHGNPWLFQ